MSGRRTVLLALLMLASAAPGGAGQLRILAEGPLPTAGLAARVTDGAGGLVAVIRSGDAEEVAAGRYRVELLTDPPIVRAGVRVPASGEVVVHFRELGLLHLRVLGEDGALLATVAEIFLGDGRRLDAIRSGGQRMLPAGTYRVVVRSKPNRELKRVVVAPGKTVELVVRLGATLRLEASGPDGARAALTARVVHPDGGVLGLAAGEALGLPPGEYDVALDTVPPSRQRVKLEPDATTVLRIDDLGALRFRLPSAPGEPAVAVTVLDPASGLVVARARNGDTLLVRPGRYRVRFETSPPTLRDGIRVAARAVVRVGAGGGTVTQP